MIAVVQNAFGALTKQPFLWKCRDSFAAPDIILYMAVSVWADEPAAAGDAAMAFRSPAVAEGWAEGEGKSLRIGTERHRYWRVASSHPALSTVSCFVCLCCSCTCGMSPLPLPAFYGVSYYFLNSVVPFCWFYISLTCKEMYFCLRKLHHCKIIRSANEHRYNARISTITDYFCKLLGRSLKYSTNLQACS